MLRINTRLSIDERELDFRTSTSGGPGGQHANKTETRVEVLWDLGRSPSLRAAERRLIRQRLANRITDDVLVVGSSDHRSQHRNKEEAIERLVELVRRAVHQDKPRRATRPTRASQQRRMDGKTKRGQQKKLRGRVRRDD